MANKIRLQFPLEVNTKQSPLLETSFDDVENIIVSREVEVEKEVYLENYKTNVPAAQRLLSEWAALIRQQMGRKIEKEMVNELKNSFLPTLGSNVQEFIRDNNEYVVDGITTTLEDDVLRMDVTMRPVQEYITINLDYTIDALK